ncbi:histidine phosphatase family protein [Hyphomonas sp. FCG-A18]|uniref:histidine phosphatase family protein n=1 Tax=Hyphomonas sp. FCG-A18 TaxID=3080019 RepID=UPI002B2B51E4|nr:histidine phosphatase family protein [Hyphomonas sp. FCG-A18]
MITLVRHGEAAAGWGDHPDPGLSDTGYAQAQAVASSLSTRSVSLILTSPMQRCRETAHALEKVLDQTALVTPEVSEIPTPEDLQQDRVDWLKGLMAGNWSDTPPVIQDWRQALIAKIVTLPDNTVVFTHFVAINAIVSGLEGSDAAVVFRPTYCSQTILERAADRLQVTRRGAEAETRVL